MTLRKDKSTPENREFWASVEAASAVVGRWPYWKRGMSADEGIAEGVVAFLRWVFLPDTSGE